MAILQSFILTIVKWVIIALLAPELVLAFAAGQLRQALKFRNAMRKLQAESTDDQVKTFDISLTYAFFAVMGGLRIRVSDVATLISVQDIFGDELRIEMHRKLTTPGSTIVLTTRGAQLLAKMGMWFYVPGEVIKNKSKANPIQKALVMLQVSWMFLQCIARKIARAAHDGPRL
ncbi:hypothetical protein SLS63_003916 [Diaporthe eres]|uniref:Uncharacterized protein n=1 Tax=Diaporthe eres TaxID=83184 RepID=A0ABR1PFF8_DIAER